jgi:cobalt/nickel transport system ATP-binding protein
VTSEPVLDIRELSYRYPQGPIALDQVTFSVSGGERIALVGPNGAGKTSLFLCLCGVLVPQAGAALVGGIDIRDAAQRRRLPGQVGIVFQNPDDQLFSATVLDDVAFGPLNQGLKPDEVRVRAIDALSRVGLNGLEERVPWNLSGGEKRRVALAGVLAMRPAILLLDEPSMYLDPRGRRELIDLLNGLGGTQVIASHDLEMVLRTCSRVLLLDAGRIIADGPAVTVLADRELMEAHGLEVPPSLLRRD